MHTDSSSHILIVDDDEHIRAFLRSVLSRQEYAVVEAKDGKEALDSAREHLPRLIISDVLMPVMDGYQLCMEWHKDEKLRGIPFVFHSGTYVDEDDEALGRSLGAADFITRPIELKDFMERIEAVLRQHAIPQAETMPINHSHETHLQAYSASLVKKLEQKMEELKIAKEKIEGDYLQQMKTQRLLRESEELFRAVFEQHAAIKIIIDPNTGAILDANEAAVKFYGWSREELKQMRIQQINTLPPEAVKEEMECARRAKKNHFDFRHRRADGSIRDVEVFSSAIEAGNKEFLHSIIHDVTDKKIMEQALRESEERYRTLVETQLEAVCRWKLDTTLTFVNAAYCQMLGKTREELIGRKWIEFVPQELHRDVLKTYETAAREKQPVIYEHEVETPQGSRWYRWHDVPICDQSGETMEFQSVGHDITDRKTAEEKLQHLTENLQKLVDERTQQLRKAHEELESFVYTVAHDLRAPIRHVSSFLQFLHNELGERVSEKAQRFMDTIEDSAKHMAALIDGLLNFARLGDIEPKYEPVDMQTLLNEVMKDFEIDVSRYNISVRCSGLHAIEADRTLIRAVLVNLIGNAIKFSSMKEHPTIEIACNPSETEHIISVRDNGIGFDMQYANKLFGIFQRLHGEKQFAGTGIGLASVKQIILRHGGRVWAEGEAGKGACFYFTIPKKHLNPISTLSASTPNHPDEEHCHE
jgi:PAS domain S-box-containing protein